MSFLNTCVEINSPLEVWPVTRVTGQSQTHGLLSLPHGLAESEQSYGEKLSPSYSFLQAPFNVYCMNFSLLNAHLTGHCKLRLQNAFQRVIQLSFHEHILNIHLEIVFIIQVIHSCSGEKPSLWMQQKYSWTECCGQIYWKNMLLKDTIVFI